MTPTKPTTVAAVRALIGGLIVAVAGALLAFTPADLAGFGPWAPIVASVLVAVGVTLLRYAEGWILDRDQPPQAGLLGGQPAPFYDWPIDEPAPVPLEVEVDHP